MIRNYGQYPNYQYVNLSSSSSNWEEWQVTCQHLTSVLPVLPPLPEGAAAGCKYEKANSTNYIGGNVWETTYRLTNDPRVPKVDTTDKQLLSYDLTAQYEGAALLACSATYFVLNGSRKAFLQSPPSDPSESDLELSGMTCQSYGQDWIYTANFSEAVPDEWTAEGDGQESKPAGDEQQLLAQQLSHTLTDEELKALLGLGSGTESANFQLWRGWWAQNRIIAKGTNAHLVTPGKADVDLGVTFENMKKICLAPSVITCDYVGLEYGVSAFANVRVDKKNPVMPPALVPPTDPMPNGFLINFSDINIFSKVQLTNLINNRYEWKWQPGGMEYYQLPGRRKKRNEVTNQIEEYSRFKRTIHWHSLLMPKPL